LPFSHLNQNGYTDVSGLLTPRDESDPTKDTDGNTLEFSGSAFPRRPVYRDSYLSTWNGTTEFLAAAHLSGSETVISSVGTSTPSISAGRVDFTAGTCSALVLSDGTIYNFSEGVGAAAHDSSGANNTGTITNASTGTEGAGFWVGRIDGETNAHDINNGFSRRMLLDGAGTYVVLDSDPFLNLSDFHVEADFVSRETLVGTSVSIIGSWRGNSNMSVLVFTSSAGKVIGRVRTTAGLATDVLSSTVLQKDTSYKIGVSYDGATIKVLIDDVVENTGSHTGDIVASSGTASPEIGRYNVQNTTIPIGVLSNVKLYNGAKTTLINQWDGNGNLDANWEDQVGSNDGTVTGSPQLIRIPADSSAPTLDVHGETLTNPAVTNGYNDAETTLDLYKIATGDTIAPETNHLSNFEDVEFSDTNYSLGTTSPVDTVFIRDDSSVAKTRLLGFSGTLTDVALVYANNFTHGERWNDLAPWDDDTFWND